MSLAVYVAHAVRKAELPALWELQSSVAAYGIAMILAKYAPTGALTTSRKAQINGADAIMSMATRASPFVEAELRYAASRKKPTFVFISPDLRLAVPGDVQKLVFQPEIRASQILSMTGAMIQKARVAGGDANADTALAAVLGIGGLLFLLLTRTAEIAVT